MFFVLILYDVLLFTHNALRRTKLKLLLGIFTIFSNLKVHRFGPFLAKELFLNGTFIFDRFVSWANAGYFIVWYYYYSGAIVVGISVF